LTFAPAVNRLTFTVRSWMTTIPDINARVLLALSNRHQHRVHRPATQTLCSRFSEDDLRLAL